jgi:hypothetical protein
MRAVALSGTTVVAMTQDLASDTRDGAETADRRSTDAGHHLY